MTDTTRKTRKPLSRKVAFAIVLAAAPLLIWLEFFKPTLSEDPVLAPIISMTLTRLIGAVVFFALILTEGYRILHPLRGFRPLGAFILFFLPPLAVVVNNLPLLSMIWGDAYIVHGTPAHWFWFSLECLAIGLFEEAAFRGVILLMFAEKRFHTRKGLFASIILTSAVFGLVHLVNLAMGAGVGAVLQQIGYSFLIGAMCSVVLFKTHNLWLCVLLHAVFDFCGSLMPTLGAGRWWDTPTVVFTVILAVFTTAYLVWHFFRLDLASLQALYPPRAAQKPAPATETDTQS